MALDAIRHALDPRRHPSRERLLVAALFILLTVFMTWPQAARLTSVPDYGDPLFSVWRLSWVAHRLPRDPAHLFNANIFYPEARTLAYSDAMLVPSLGVAPFLWLGAHPLRTYTIAFLALFVLSGVAMYALVHRLTGSRWAALVAGIVFAFFPFRFDHYSHFELQVAFWMPLALLAVHRVFERPGIKAGVATGLGIAGQALSSLYYGIFFTTFLIPVGLVLWFGHREKWKVVGVLAAGALVAAMLILPAIAPYRAVQEQFGERQRWEVAAYSAEWKSFVTSTVRSVVWGKALDDPSTDPSEKRLFPGLLVVLLAIAALWPPIDRTRVAYALGLAVAIELCRGLNGVVYPYLYEWLMPFRGLRVPARFMIVVSLALAILAGYGLARLLARIPVSRQGWRHAAGAAVALAVLVEYRPTLDLKWVWEQPPSVYAWFAGRPPAVIMEVPSASEVTGAMAEAKYLYFSTFHWQKLLTGNSGFFPPSHTALFHAMKRFPDESSLFYLRQRRVNYLIVHGAFCDEKPLREALEYMENYPHARLIGVFGWERSHSWLFELVPPVS